jgi:excisionase family DNA binding protein
VGAGSLAVTLVSADHCLDKVHGAQQREHLGGGVVPGRDRCEGVDSSCGTSVRFPRRLIAERRIVFVRVGRHVRIPEGAINEMIASGTVEPIDRRRRRGVA